MPAAVSKAEFLAVFDRERAKLERLLESVDETRSRLSDDGVSIKAVIGHRIHWMDLFWSWYDAGVKGAPVQTPAPGFKWNQLKAYNAPIYAAAETEPWSTLASRFSQTADRFRTRFDALSEEDAYGPSAYAWTNDWTVGRWAESAAPSHFRSAAKVVRKILKTAPQ